ncbi:MAG: hypothetical protein K8T26_14410 [Lentisphaerae bacterium]|nr:hypothetical protein [Lentisphaerota bacterium]
MPHADVTPPLPGHAEQPPDIMCGSCGRFVGALTRCPHCGARISGRLSVRLFRYAAVLLSTVGLGLLYLMAIRREIPLVQVGALSPTMNFAYVRVAGTVAGDARVSRDGNRVRSVRFIVDDGTGEIPVTAYGAKGQALLSGGRLPHDGDHAEVTGSLNVSADRVALYLQSPEHLVIQRAEAPPARLADLTPAQRGQAVAITGHVTHVSPPKTGSKQPWSVGVSDGSATRDLVLWPDVYAALANAAALTPGAGIRVRVSIGTYRDRLQLRVETAADLQVTAPGDAGAPP